MSESGIKLISTETSEQRSRQMRLIKSKNTKPEMGVRRTLFAMGYRYRLHAKSLPGQPDIVFPAHKKAIFVHGCFWHRHSNCRQARLPKSKLDYWLPKLEANQKRDAARRRELRRLGWNVMVIWECQTKRKKFVQKRLARFLTS